MDLPNPLLRVVPVGALLVVQAGCSGSAAGGRPDDAGVDVASDTRTDLTPADACSSDGMGGGGTCPINVCGQVKAAALLAPGEVATTGADALCTPPYACVPAGPTADGTALQLRCVAPLAGAAAFGAACVTGSAAGARCRDDALCIEVATTPGAPFCSALCRADADCPAQAYCLEQAAPLPNGGSADVGMCVPAAKIGATPCAREADCPAGQGCVAYGARAGLYVCRAGGTKSLGDACTAPAQCRSGECLDRDGYPAGSTNRAACTGMCSRNSDCGADQRCTRVVLSNNGTPEDPRDDVLAGYCRTLFVQLASAACADDAACVARGDGSDTCSTKYGLCYRAGAAVGAPCSGDGSCDLGASCMTGVRFPGGYCLAAGCAPGATGGVDACPGAGSVCSQRASDQPVHVCYEGCAQSGDCSGLGVSYACEDPQPGAGEPKVCLGGN